MTGYLARFEVAKHENEAVPELGRSIGAAAGAAGDLSQLIEGIAGFELTRRGAGVLANFSGGRRERGLLGPGRSRSRTLRGGMPLDPVPDPRASHEENGGEQETPNELIGDPSGT